MDENHKNELQSNQIISSENKNNNPYNTNKNEQKIKEK